MDKEERDGLGREQWCVYVDRHPDPGLRLEPVGELWPAVARAEADGLRYLAELARLQVGLRSQRGETEREGEGGRERERERESRERAERERESREQRAESREGGRD